MNRKERRARTRQAEASPQEIFRHGVEHQLAGRTSEALRSYQAALAREPGHYRARYNMALALTAMGRKAEALTAYRQVIATRPDFTEAHLNLGSLLADVGSLKEAIACLTTAAEVVEDKNGILLNLGRLQRIGGHFADAEATYLRLLIPHPGLAEAHFGLGNVHQAQGRMAEAMACFERALELKPDDSSTLNNLGACLRTVGQVDKAFAVLRHAIALDPRCADAHNNLGLILRQKGDYDESLASFRRALAVAPNMAGAHHNLLFTMQYVPSTTPQSMLAAARQWCARMAPRQETPPHLNLPDPDRRLRIGYLSPDFREHAVCYYLEPLIRAHDRTRVEVFCYAEVTRPDAVTERIRATADHWRFTSGMRDDALASTIRGDGIDILVDCAGHTGGNRLLTMARRPAPVQVATIFGYSATTGLDAIDYTLGDPFITPPGSEAFFSEKLVRLPRNFAPFLPRESWPEVAPPGDGTDQGIVFGCVADPARIDQRTLVLWRRILDRVPGSRILAKHALFNDPALREGWQARFAVLGDRLTLEGTPGGWGANMDVYGRVSVVLDSPMQSGATTVLIPLWMGVPVVTMAEIAPWQRFGASILGNLGLPDLVAVNDDDYVDKAVALAADRGRLDDLRRTLRPMMRTSPLCDARLVVGDIETAYREMWRAWCAGHTGAFGSV
ncbi:MAG: tetratricopeptide repeat protein [Alphaproteobacteria bacterium]